MIYSSLLHRCKRLLCRSRRKIYGARSLIPAWSEQHKFESMVGPLGFWDQLQEYQLNVLVQHGLQPHHSLLDVGCGPLQGGVAFISYLKPGKYTGIDASTEKLEAAYLQIERNGLAHKNPILIHSLSFGKDELGGKNFDFIWASQLLYYLDESKLAELLELARDRLHENGLFICDIIGPQHYECREHEHGYCLHNVESLSEMAGRYGFCLADRGEIMQYGYPSRLSLKTNRLLVLHNPSKPIPLPLSLTVMCSLTEVQV